MNVHHPAHPTATAGTVVLLHGLSLGAWAMARVEFSLAWAGYRVVNLTYPSISVPLEKLAEQWLPDHLADAQALEQPDLHFVTHSMGGIVLRGWLRRYGVPPHLRRVVMLVPPNQGTELVDRLSNWRSFRLLTGLNGCRLGTDARSFPCTLGPWPAGPELGILAADAPLAPPVVPWTTEPHDGKVPVARTRLQGMTDHLVLHHSHTWIQYRAAAIQQIHHFLQTGRFARDNAQT